MFYQNEFSFAVQNEKLNFALFGKEFKEKKNNLTNVMKWINSDLPANFEVVGEWFWLTNT